MVFQFAGRGELKFASRALVYVGQSSHGRPPFLELLVNARLVGSCGLTPRLAGNDRVHNGAARTSAGALTAEHRQPSRSVSLGPLPDYGKIIRECWRVPDDAVGHPGRACSAA
jgi:hypothetical protein